MSDQILNDGPQVSADEQRTATDAGDRPLGKAEDEDMATVPVHRVKTPLPDTGVEPESVFQTHDVHGGGNPRLVPMFDDSIDLALARSEPGLVKQLNLLPGITTIGSETASEICLPDLLPRQAEIHRDDVDEYVFVNVSNSDENSVDGRHVDSQVLRTGNRVALGPWTFTYMRDEHADHGSPFGGHSGGEMAGYRAEQPTPRPRGTSPEGGSEPTADDPGEYY
ncbi:MAG: hypothetical protein ACOYD0_12165 [Candidatus Nanopelagicales bacterium]